MGKVIKFPRHARTSAGSRKALGSSSASGSACAKVINLAGGMNPRLFQLLTAEVPTPAKDAAAAGPPTALMMAETELSMSARYSRAVNLSTVHKTVVDSRRVNGIIQRMAETAKTIGNRLLITREALGLKAADVCRRIDCKPNRWSQYESGERPITIPVANRLCDEYGLTLDWIYRADPARLPHELRLKMPRTAA